MASIEIKTTQNVTIEYDLATVADRIFAYILDFVIVLVVNYVIIAILLFFMESVIMDSGGAQRFLGQLMFLFLFIAYHFLFEVVKNGQSIGKMALKIRVVRLDGRTPKLSDHLLRAFLQIVDGIFSLGILGALLISSSPKRQRLGDLAANTAVIKNEPVSAISLHDILKINTLDNYEPVYLEVKNMKEADMLVIKRVLTRYQAHPNDATTQIVRDTVTKLTQILDLPQEPPKKLEFLKTLIKDYIVLTR